MFEMASELRPIGLNVLIEIVDEPQTTLIVVPERLKLLSQRGVVLECGPKVDLINECAPDDLVVIPRTAGLRYRQHGRDFMLIPSSDILGVIISDD
jgi:co-chaperonin GroES (HSP10)